MSRNDSRQKSVSCDGFHKWLIFVSAYVIMIIDVGYFYTLGKLFVVIISTFNSTRAEAALVQSTMMGVFMGLGIVNGAFVHKFGPRKAGLTGACFVSIGAIVSFFASSVTFLVFSIGVCMAMGISMLFISCSTVVGHYFVGKTSLLALSVLSTGSGLGGMAYPYLLGYLNNEYGLRGTLLIIGGIALNNIPMALLWWTPQKQSIKASKKIADPENDSVRASPHDAEHFSEKPPLSNMSTACNAFTSAKDHDNSNDALNKHEQFKTLIYTVQSGKKTEVSSQIVPEKLHIGKISTLESLKYLARNPCFVTYTIGLALVNPSLSLFVIFVIDIFTDKGFTDAQSSTGLLMMNVFSILGRLSPGLLLQISRVSVLCIPICGTILGIAGTLSFIFVKSLELNILVCCAIGLAIGMYVSAFSVTTLKLVGREHLPNAIGTIFTINAIGNAVAGPISGLIRDKTGSYDLCFGSASAVMVIGFFMFVVAQYLRNQTKRKRTRGMSIFYLTKL